MPAHYITTVPDGGTGVLPIYNDTTGIRTSSVFSILSVNMLEYKVISPNRNHVTSIEEAKTYLLRDQDPFLSLVRPPKSNFDDLGNLVLSSC